MRNSEGGRAFRRIKHSESSRRACTDKEEPAAILKGFRSPEDVTYELEHADFNREMCAGLETYLLPSPPYLRKISSTLVKQLWQEGKNLEGVTTTETIRLLADKKKRSV